MLKIGEFSKLSIITVKAPCIYEKEGLLPAKVELRTGCLFYDMAQLESADELQ